MKIPRVEGMLRVLVLLLLGVLPLTSALAATPPLTQPNAYAVLVELLEQKIKDRAVLWLIGTLLEASHEQ